MSGRLLGGGPSPTGADERRVYSRLANSFSLGERRGAAIARFALPVFVLLDVVAFVLAVIRGGQEWTAFVLVTLITVLWAMKARAMRAAADRLSERARASSDAD
jgi:hypothetical protein